MDEGTNLTVFGVELDMKGQIKQDLGFMDEGPNLTVFGLKMETKG